jgi:hypothetical protein
MKMPVPASPAAAAAAPAVASAETAPAGAVPVSPSTDLGIGMQAAATESPIAANDETDILEMPLEVETVSPPTPDIIPAEEILAGEDKLTFLPASEVTASQPVSEQPAIAEPLLASAATVLPGQTPVPAVASRGAVAHLRKCEACGFPVSEGRQLCLDCEKKKVRDATTVAKPAAGSTQAASTPSAQTSPPPVEMNTAAELPRFLGGEAEEASWLSTHKFMVVAIVVAAVGIVVVLLVR